MQFWANALRKQRRWRIDDTCTDPGEFYILCLGPVCKGQKGEGASSLESTNHSRSSSLTFDPTGDVKSSCRLNFGSVRYVQSPDEGCLI